MAKILIQWKTEILPLVVFRGFAGWLVLALEFLLAADILRTAISPTWNDIGQLAAIRLQKAATSDKQLFDQMTELYPHWVANQSWLMFGFPQP